MEGKRLLRSIQLKNILSYGPESGGIELEPLNVLIGPNGSGKSNLIEAISILKAAPGDLSVPIREGGGIAEWIWKGDRVTDSSLLEIRCSISALGKDSSLDYYLRVAPSGYQIVVDAEAITVENPTDFSPESGQTYYVKSAKSPHLSVLVEIEASSNNGHGQRRQNLGITDDDPTQSILALRKDPDRFPEITYLGKVFSQIYFFRNPNFGHRSPLRGPQPADLPTSFLMENGGNLGMVLNDLLNRPTTKRVVLEHLRRFYDSVEDVTTKVHAGVVETLFHERGLHEAIPASRLSDGTLRFLSLLTILCHPAPPPLVCIEDPELGLHPDVLPIVAELMIDASQRTQLIVTTHSDILVSALSSVPECIIVCEKDDRGTQLRRLEPARLCEWLEKYSLGELWRMGETGGNP